MRIASAAWNGWLYMATRGAAPSRGCLWWLLVAVAVVLAPHLPRGPAWVAAFVIGIWAWRVAIAGRGFRQPSRLIIAAFALLGIFSTLASYHTLLGRDAGVILLQLMLVLKLLELRSKRDAMVAVFLSFFVLLTHFLHSQTLPMGAYMIGAIWLLVATLVALNRNDEPAPLVIGRTSAMIILQSVPLMLVLYLLVPRVEGPLWGMPKNASAGVSGLSDEMSPGSIGALALSDGIAFRAEFDGPIPPPRALYWRAVVMNDFDGRTWRASRGRGDRVPAPVHGVGAALDYRVTLEPHSRRWIFALDLPDQIPQGTRLTADYQVLATTPLTSRARFALSSFLSYRAGMELTPEDVASNRIVPPGNPRAAALAASLRGAGGNPQEIIARALNYFRAESFSYTLTPAVVESDPIDVFLFDAKAGFCEHYAGAFTFLMRAAGLPARVVTGYQGGEVNPIGDYLIVRQADAHAWSEVWLPQRGWVRIDPTAVVAPARVDSGIHAVIPENAIMPGLITVDEIEWLRSFRFSWDAVNNQWNQWVLGYNFDRQKRLMAQLGQKDASWQDLTIALMIASAVVVFTLSALLLLRRVKLRRDPTQAAYEKFCISLARLGVNRHPFEGPLDFSARAVRLQPRLAPAIATISETYANLRYAPRSRMGVEEFRRLVTDFASTIGRDARRRVD